MKLTKVPSSKPKTPTKDPLRHWRGNAVQLVDRKSIHPWDSNPRVNDGDAVRMLAAIISERGFVDPIVALADTKQIVAGHTRWKASEVLGMTEVPVLFVDMDSVESMAYAISNNRASEFASWDDRMLLLELEDLERHGIDLNLVGFDADEAMAAIEEMHELDDGLVDDGDDDEVEDSFTVTVKCVSRQDAQNLVIELSARGFEADTKE